MLRKNTDENNQPIHLKESINAFQTPSLLVDSKGALVHANLKLYDLLPTAKKSINFIDYLNSHSDIKLDISLGMAGISSNLITTHNNAHITWNIIESYSSHTKYYVIIANKQNAIQPSNQDWLTDTIIEHVPAQIFWKDTNLVYQGCNEAFLKSLNLSSKKEVIGKTDFDLPVVKEDSEKYRNDDKKVIQSQSPRLNMEEKQVLEDGTTRYLITSKIPLKNAKQEVVGVLAVYVDISQQKELSESFKKAKEKAEVASEAKTKFIANMSHDIRTPLTGIVGLSEILIDSVVKQESRDYAKMLNLSGEQLLSLLNSILDIVASNNLDESKVNLSSFSIYELLHNIFELQLPALKLKGIQLKLKTGDNLPSHIETDKGKLYRILLTPGRDPGKKGS